MSLFTYFFPDLYIAAKMVDYLTFTMCGRPQYMAPEIVEAKGEAKLIVLLTSRSGDC